MSGLVPENARQLSLFESTSIRQEDPAATVRMQDTRTMEVMDALNKRYGSGVVKLGATMSTTQTEGWKMQRSLLSPRYTTNFHEIQIARCR